MRVHLAALFVMLASSFASPADGRDVPDELSKWILTKVDLREGTPLWYAANHVGTPWEVYKSGSVVKVRKYVRPEVPAIFQRSNGKLICYDRGEFGSQVYWAP